MGKKLLKKRIKDRKNVERTVSRVLSADLNFYYNPVSEKFRPIRTVSAGDKGKLYDFFCQPFL